MVLLVAATAIAATAIAMTSIVAVDTNRGRVGDPFSGVQLFVDRHSAAAQAAATLEDTHAADAALLRKIASQPVGIWLGNWIPTRRVAATVGTVMREAAARGSMPLFVLYAKPYRDCGHRAGGLAKPHAYERWIGQVVKGIGRGKAAVILEPDAIAQGASSGCLTRDDVADRLEVIHRAVDQLTRSPNTAVYLDAGHSGWHPAKVIAPLLLAAGVDGAAGFSLNVSNFKSTAAEEAYGDKLSRLVNRAHYVIDTSRNGAATAETWCNPPGQALGMPPTASTDNPLVDAVLWIKPPGASDGPCNGGPPAGMFWVPYARNLAANARW